MNAPEISFWVTDYDPVNLTWLGVPLEICRTNIRKILIVVFQRLGTPEVQSGPDTSVLFDQLAHFEKWL